MGETHTDQTQEPTFEMSDLDWEYLLARLQATEVVLFIGPGILPFPGHNCLEDALHQYLVKTSEESGRPFIKKFYRDDKFFMLDEANENMSMWSFMSHYGKFFEKNDTDLGPAREVVRKLVSIPFSTIISFIPNTLIEDAFGEDYTFHTDLYKKKKKPNPYVQGTKEDPLLYYMRGKMTDDESMIISHSDLFDYLESIYEANSMEEEFKSVLKSAKYYVFLGLPFESWYMQLLMRLFQVHLVKPQILALKRFPENGKSHKAVYEDLYKLEFHESKGNIFIEQLYQRCSDLKILRSAGEDEDLIASFDREVEALEAKMKEGLHEEALDLLETLSVKYLDKTKHDEYFKTLLLGASNYRSAQRSHTIGLIDDSDLGKEKAKLTLFLDMQFKELKSLVHGQ